MSTADSFQHVSNCEKYNRRGTLLEKYKIPIQNFDFDYVKTCKDANKLEKIIEVLKSGEEGYYPELLKSTEDQLRTVRPNSRVLRESCPVLDRKELKKDELNELAIDLESWVMDISKNNKELIERKVNKPTIDVEIRKNVAITEDLSENEKKEKRIKSTDYETWEKYDPDTEILKMDLQEEKMKKSFTTVKPILKKSVTFNKFATETEAQFVSNRELEKGEECYKSGDFEEALTYFSSSISTKPTVENYINRAMTYINLRKFDKARNDAEKALAIEPNNVKALLSKAQALEGLKKHEYAMEIVDKVIEMDPNNITAQELANRIRPLGENVLKNTKMKIVEIE